MRSSQLITVDIGQPPLAAAGVCGVEFMSRASFSFFAWRRGLDPHESGGENLFGQEPCDLLRLSERRGGVDRLLGLLPEEHCLQKAGHGGAERCERYARLGAPQPVTVAAGLLDQDRERLDILREDRLAQPVDRVVRMMQAQ